MNNEVGAYYLRSMRVELRHGRTVLIRSWLPGDENHLFDYLQQLSAESRSRFGPHAFDMPTIRGFSAEPADGIQRYIAVDELTGKFVAYMLILQGMTEPDRQRYANRNQFFDPVTTATFAPSVADEWQSSGLGTAMSEYIDTALKKNGILHIVLWGGVQATNIKAVNFYRKNGYRLIDSFRHDDKDNYDMLKELS